MLTNQEMNELIWKLEHGGDNVEDVQTAIAHLEEADWEHDMGWRAACPYFMDDMRIAYDTILHDTIDDVAASGQHSCYRALFIAAIIDGEGNLLNGPETNTVHPDVREVCRQDDACVRSLQGLPRLGFYESCPARHAAENLNPKLVPTDYYFNYEPKERKLIWIEAGIQFRDEGAVEWSLDTEADYTEKSIYPCIRCLSKMHSEGVDTLVVATHDNISVHSVEAHLKVLIAKNVLSGNS